ncbi:hypothetical protein AB0O76_13280 [Streptomyces sp. NPDC086554]|uniref:hypothetical protein n=1 Tax=Streptomyces sp. NPDC086554 TaxID=3154864 RepID=UPI00342E0F02
MTPHHDHHQTLPAKCAPEALIDLRVGGLRLVFYASAPLRTVIGGLLTSGAATLIGYLAGLR